MARTAAVRLYYLPELDTLDLWVGEPAEEALAEPLNDNVVLKLDGEGDVIGLEIISLGRLDPEALEKLPENLRRMLCDALEKIASKARQLRGEGR